MNRLQAAEQLRKALQMFASTLTEEQALEVATVYPMWETGRSYAVGDIINYGTNSVGDPQLYSVPYYFALRFDTSSIVWLS